MAQERKPRQPKEPGTPKKAAAGTRSPRKKKAPAVLAQAPRVVEGEVETDTPEPSLEEVEPSPEELGEEEVDATGVALVPLRDAPERVLGPVSRDPMQAYMAEVTRHPLLTREEEHDLAVRFRDTGDVKAAYRLVASNLRLVVKLAHQYHRNPLSLLDLIQEGNIGLMQAVKKFDPERGVKLSSYSAWWIRAYILRYIMDNWKMVKLGTTEAQRKLFFKLRQEQEKLLSQGFEASPKLLAERLNVTEQDVVEMDQRLGQDELSLDAPIHEDSTATRADRMLPSQSAPADETIGNEQLRVLFREKLSEFAQALVDKERFIYEKRLIADEPLTLQEIGDQYGFSRERARQIEAALIGRIREYLRSQIPDFDLVASPKG
ncbi:MAG: RNA polymerase factor sigma-32 [Myxococcota bacterium]|nr:RNA polymerase factor sigma-32 [Myxococcota bacterium]